MWKPSSTWYDMFPEYYDNAKIHIEKIKSRLDKDIFAPNAGDKKDDLEVEIISQTELKYSGSIKLKDILARLQYLAHYNGDKTQIKPKCTIHMNILGKTITFKLEESVLSTGIRGWQILVYDDADSKPKYNTLMMSLLKIDPCKLARTILTALNTPLDSQTKLNEYSDSDVSNNVRMFILLTHIAEAAVPSIETLDEFSELIQRNKFVSQDQRKSFLITKHGRTPMMDKIVRAKLRKCAYLPIFSKEFSAEEFPSQSSSGTKNSRIRALEGYEIDHLSDIEDDLPLQMEALAIKKDSDKIVQMT